MPRLEPTTKGILEGLGIVTATAVPFGIAFAMLPYPSQALLEGVASFGGALVLAYVVLAAWMARQATSEKEGKSWVGFMSGCGLAGFLGVILALMLAAHREAGHKNFLDVLGFSWSVTSLFILGLVVTLQPFLVYRLLHGREEREPSKR